LPPPPPPPLCPYTTLFRSRSPLATNLDRAYLDDQPVVGGRDACRQTRRELRMRRRVGEVREEGPARTDLLRRRDGLRDREMQRVRARQQGVQHQHLEPRQLGER